MHLTEPDDQGRTKQPGLACEVAMKLAIAPKYVGITRLKRNDVFAWGVVDPLDEMTAIQRVMGQDRFNQVCRDRAAERALVSKRYQLATIADGTARSEDWYDHGEHARVVMKQVRTHFRRNTVANGNIALELLSRAGLRASKPCGVVEESAQRGVGHQLVRGRSDLAVGSRDVEVTVAMAGDAIGHRFAHRLQPFVGKHIPQPHYALLVKLV